MAKQILHILEPNDTLQLVKQLRLKELPSSCTPGNTHLLQMISWIRSSFAVCLSKRECGLSCTPSCSQVKAQIFPFRSLLRNREKSRPFPRLRSNRSSRDWWKRLSPSSFSSTAKSKAWKNDLDWRWSGSSPRWPRISRRKRTSCKSEST